MRQYPSPHQWAHLRKLATRPVLVPEDMIVRHSMPTGTVTGISRSRQDKIATGRHSEQEEQISEVHEASDEQVAFYDGSGTEFSVEQEGETYNNMFQNPPPNQLMPLSFDRHWDWTLENHNISDILGDNNLYQKNVQSESYRGFFEEGHIRCPLSTREGPLHSRRSSDLLGLGGMTFLGLLNQPDQPVDPYDFSVFKNMDADWDTCRGLDW